MTDISYIDFWPFSKYCRSLVYSLFGNHSQGSRDWGLCRCDLGKTLINRKRFFVIFQNSLRFSPSICIEFLSMKHIRWWGFIEKEDATRLWFWPSHTRCRRRRRRRENYQLNCNYCLLVTVWFPVVLFVFFLSILFSIFFPLSILTPKIYPTILSICGAHSYILFAVKNRNPESSVYFMCACEQVCTTIVFFRLYALFTTTTTSLSLFSHSPK